MIYDDIQEFTAACPSMRALVGLDLGDKTIGVAVSDIYCTIASPLETIRRRKFTLDAEHLLAIIDKRRIGGIILGLPFNMDGSQGPRCQSTRAFARVNHADIIAGRVDFGAFPDFFAHDRFSDCR